MTYTYVHHCQVCGAEVRGSLDVMREHWFDHVASGQVCSDTVIPQRLEKIQEGNQGQPAKGSAAWRKQRPIASGVLDYFPDALAEVAYTSWVGNEQHHPGAPLHWDKSKSSDEADALLRHLAQRGTLDTDGVRHTAKVAWRALALLQRELDTEREK